MSRLDAVPTCEEAVGCQAASWMETVKVLVAERDAAIERAEAETRKWRQAEAARHAEEQRADVAITRAEAAKAEHVTATALGVRYYGELIEKRARLAEAVDLLRRWYEAAGVMCPSLAIETAPLFAVVDNPVTREANGD